MEEASILTAFEGGKWLSGPSLVQFDYQSFLLPKTGEEQPGRTPGVLTGTIDGTRVALGVKDFWQNFPSELEIDEAGFTFYNWPRSHN